MGLCGGKEGGGGTVCGGKEGGGGVDVWWEVRRWGDCMVGRREVGELCGGTVWWEGGSGGDGVWWEEGGGGTVW